MVVSNHLLEYMRESNNHCLSRFGADSEGSSTLSSPNIYSFFSMAYFALHWERPGTGSNHLAIPGVLDHKTFYDPSSCGSILVALVVQH